MPFAIFKKRNEMDSEQLEVLEGLREAADELATARERFNRACEPELVEECVYEINARQARYAYFLRIAREKDIRLTVAYDKKQKAENF